MSDLKTVQTPESVGEQVFDNSNAKQVPLRDVLTSNQVTEVEA